ncbi:MAG: manganese catalase family protein [Clostridia bacterium]|nr:manganese catalase family protein [Clostridia bacterium]
MFVYEKKLQYPINIKRPNLKLAKIIASQYGGPNGELGASLRYLSQRFAMPYEELKAAFTDIGNEELSHLEMVGTIIYQLTKGVSVEEVEKCGFADYFVDHTTGIYPQSAAGEPFTAAMIASSGDVIADLSENLAAEQKARLVYDNILRFADDADVRDPIRFLRARELVHYQRFGECLRIAQDRLNCKNFYAINPSFDKK